MTAAKWVPIIREITKLNTTTNQHKNTNYKSTLKVMNFKILNNIFTNNIQLYIKEQIHHNSVTLFSAMHLLRESNSHEKFKKKYEDRD